SGSVRSSRMNGASSSSRRRRSNRGVSATTPSAASGRVLGDAIAEGPVLLDDLDEVDEDVLQPDARLLGEIPSDRGEEILLLVEAPAERHRDLNEHDAVRARDAEIVPVEHEAAREVTVQDLEAVLRRDPDRLDEGAVHAVADQGELVGRAAIQGVDAHERHASLLRGELTRPP